MTAWPSTAAPPVTPWRSLVAPYHQPDSKLALWQVSTSFLPYIALWYLMVRSLEISYGLTLGLAVLAAGFLVRVFIVLHDCGHGSFLRSRRWNDAFGFVGGVLSFTPYHYWRHTHAIHHATAGNLDRRGVGDIWTMTMREYREASPWCRLRFRLYRNPFCLFLVGPVFVVLIKNRFAGAKFGWRWQRSVLWANLAMLGLGVALSLALGVQSYVLIQLPVLIFSTAFGVWLFYVQHQFEGVSWQRQQHWDHFTTAMRGSSYYALPKVLQWFSGNIGFHHIHHLSPRIPNYFLERCHRENPLLQKATKLRLFTSLRSIRYRVWDEERNRLVGLGLPWL